MKDALVMDNVVVEQAIQTLRRNCLRAVEDKKWGRVGITISFESGRATTCEETTSGTIKPLKS